MTSPLSLEDAQRRVLALAVPLPVEQPACDDAMGRYLAEPLVARRTRPAADLSSMDGFAVAGPGPWAVVGESRAGRPFAGALEKGQAVSISTGAVLPEGCNAIALREDATFAGDRLRSREEPLPGRHIRRRGFDFMEGEELLAAGVRVTAAVVAVARASGHSTLTVRRRPRVAILETGDELAADPADCPDHCVPATNGAMLAAMVASGVPCEIVRIGPVPDDRAALGAALVRADSCDMLVTSGGASVGEHDLLRPALDSWGAQLEFWRVAIRPGKPLVVARRGAQTVLGLPGNPASAYVTAFLFVLPLLRALSGAATPLPRPVSLPLETAVPEGGSRREFLRAKLGGRGLRPLFERDSSALGALAKAEALIDRPPNAPRAEAGETVSGYILEIGGFA